MFAKHYIGWVRDEKGKVLSRPIKHFANAVTTMVGGVIQARTDLGILHRIYSVSINKALTRPSPREGSTPLTPSKGE